MDITPDRPELSIDELSVVLVGDFNPTIFHPIWFVHQGLIRGAEADEADIKIIHQDAAEFSLEWISVQVLRDRFSLTVKADAYQEHLLDLVLGTFRQVSHTPVRQFGINTSFLARFRGVLDWHSFGHFLAPKSPWNGVLNKPGMRGLFIQGDRDDEQPGYLSINVKPLPNHPNGLGITVNDHYEHPNIPAGRAPLDATWATTAIEASYTGSIARATAITTQLIENYCGVHSVDDGN